LCQVVTLTCALLESEASSKRPSARPFERPVWVFILFPEVILLVDTSAQ
jgi:hypothetical protein